MAIESWVLDGVTLTSGNFTLLELTADPPKARNEWLSAADSEGATLARQPLHENRTITMKLRVAPQASMDAALDQLGAVVDKLAKADNTPDGVALTWTPTGSARTVTFDVLGGEVTELPIAVDGQGRSWLNARPIFTIELTCKPYWRGSEVLTSTAASGAVPFVALDVTGVTGDVPALGRLIVTDSATQSRRHVEWGIGASTVSPIIDSDSMVTTGFAGAQAAQSGAYDPNATGNNVVRATLSAAATAVVGTGDLTHVGSFRVKARVRGTGTTRVRFTWQAGAGPWYTNAYAAPIGGGNFSEIDLGVIQIPMVVTGTQRWRGRVEAYSTVGGDGLDVDYLLLVPVDNGYGKSRGEFLQRPGAVVGWDEFTGTTAAGVLNARAAPTGGTWATTGAATDFAFADAPGTQETVSRATVSDASARLAALGSTNYTDTQVQVGIDPSNLVQAQSVKLGALARYVDGSNYLMAYVSGEGNGNARFTVAKVIAGVPTTLGVIGDIAADVSNYWTTVSVTVYASGYFYAYWRDSTNTALIVGLGGQDSTLATGGSLQTGKPGIIDQNPSATASTRYYDNFYAFTPLEEPIVLYSGLTLEVRHNDTLRNSGSSIWGRPPSYRGTRFLVPAGSSRVLVKAYRDDIEAVPSFNVTDATTIQVGYTPRGIAVPR